MPNHLANETSPYLLQHATNPVDWYPWGNEAFDAATARDRPVLLSVGYSSCHWCHVMAHESFEDAATARLMNDLFVNVKVDREERPDVDAVYMEAIQAMTGGGGWPMTVFLTPDRQPFFGGTYFPAVERHGMPSFRQILLAVADAWDEHREDLVSQAGHLSDLVARRLPVADLLPDRELLASSYRDLAKRFDETAGGFGAAPKFPQEPVLEFLLRVAGQPWAPKAGHMARRSLEGMAAGGIYDQVGGGFARYSVDGSWSIPHFEKMLYTNAQLARLYLHAAREVARPSFLAVATGTLEYLLRDLRLPGGAFASAEDADSEGSEGTFYLWGLDEFTETVGPELAPLAIAYFGVTREGNFEGRTHLRVANPDAATLLGIEPHTAHEMLATARSRLLAHRSLRPRPGLDGKVVAAWNGLAVRAFAEAGAVLGEKRYLDAARRSASFLLSHLTDVSGRLMRTWAVDRAVVPGFADDYAAVAVGLFALYQATGETRWYVEAIRLTEALVTLFSAPGGGFFTTGRDVEAPLARKRDHFDSPSPSANSLAAEALLLASRYTGRADLRAEAEGAVRAGTPITRSAPSAAGYLLAVVHTMETVPPEVAIVGSRADELATVVWERFRPGVALAIDRDGSGADVVPLLEGRFSEETLAYVCRGFACDLPVADAAGLRARLEAPPPP
jgi:uncharacterized protein YyaL (SSP411 family)